VAYLLWLAWNCPRPAGWAGRRRPSERGLLAGRGAYVNIKAWMLALAIVGGWITGHADAMQRLAVVVPIMLVYAFASNCSYALAGSLLRTWLSGPHGTGRRLVWFNRSMAVVLLITALWMLAL
jgi:threonine/homoserine/homoserine lactone efflux protein